MIVFQVERFKTTDNTWQGFIFPTVDSPKSSSQETFFYVCPLGKG